MAEVIVDKLQGGHYAFLEELPNRVGQTNLLIKLPQQFEL
jgi:hypothetical protein